MKILLYPFAIVLEIILITLCWSFMLVKLTIISEWIMDYVLLKLPNKEWYFSKKL